jgi:hypothetical protein
MANANRKAILTSLRLVAGCLCLLGTGFLFSPGACAGVISYIMPVSVLTYHNDIARTGQNTNETILTPANVGSANFALLFSNKVDGYVFAQPLAAANVAIPGRGVHNLLIIATEHDSVYAFDADNKLGANASPIWQISFINPAAGITTVPASDTSSSEIANEIGITCTPVIDPATETVYVSAKTKEVSGTITNYVHRLHALDLTTGAEKFGGPVIITATVVGNGDGSTNGSLWFNPLRHLNRLSLLLNNGIVYVGFASLGDKTPYHGWLFGYNAQTLALATVYNATPNGSDGGFWESACGPAADTNGNIYISTGNGSYDGPTNNDYGDSLIKLSTTNGLALSDYFTPHDQDTLNSDDLDFGSGGITLLPDEAGSAAHPHLLVCAAKQGTIYLVDRDNLSHFNPVDQIVQEMPSNILKSWGSPAYYAHTVYYIGASDMPEAFSMSNAVIGATISSNTTIYGSTGGSPSVSANGTSNAIVWAINVPNHFLHAYYATNIATEIGTGQNIGSAVKFTVATVANGKVYVGAISNVLVYGLNTPAITAEPQSVQVPPRSNVTFSVTATTTAPPLHYQWFENAATLLNQTNSTLTITNAQAANAGVYSVVVSDTVGSAFSVNAILGLAWITENINGTITVNFVGMPGVSNQLQAATNLNAPNPWQIIWGTNAPSGGLWQFTDPGASNYPQRFYRSASP